MRMKRLLCAVLAAACLWAGIPAAAPAARAVSPAFTDIADPEVREAAALLQILGVVDGDGGGRFYPDQRLTRAQFCKMAVEIRGEGGKARAQSNRTIFLDVPATHWGRGYINYASSVSVTEGGERLVMGVGDGTFHPDEDIAFDQAVTMTMRLLGYTAADVPVGATWYDGYLSMAETVDLLEGLSAPHDAPLTRAQAALLFRNLLFAEPKDSDDAYLTSLGGQEVEGGVVLDADAAADDGDRAVETTKGVYKTERTFSADLEGVEGKAVLDKDGKLIAFVPKEGAVRRVVNLTSAQATYLMASGGEKLTVEPETVVYRDGEASTWADTYLELSPPAPVTFHYGANGKLSYLFFSDAGGDDEGVMVARRVPTSTSVNPFGALAAGASYTMYKNGAAATAADVRQYDVATYDPAARVIQVSDLKLTGVYEEASPSPAAPVTIKVLGRDFPVLSTARSDLASFKPGDQITLLLTGDARVAGVVSADTVKGQAVGIARVSGTTAAVELLQGGLTVTGAVSKSAQARCDGQLVMVSSVSKGKLSLSVVSSGAAARGDLDVSARTLGGREVAENAAVYDRVENGKLAAVDYDDLTMTTIPRRKIDFVGYDYAGRVRYLVLNDATGDAYEYGFFAPAAADKEPVYQTKTETVTDTDGNPILDSDGTVLTRDVVVYENGEPVILGYERRSGSFPTLCVRQGDANGGETTTERCRYDDAVRPNKPGGVAYGLGTDVSTGESISKITAVVELQALKDVPRAAFDAEEMTFTVAGVVWPVSEKVQCWNDATETWFPSGEAGVAAARAYADALTLYYDRDVSEGGKIRVIVAE